MTSVPAENSWPGGWDRVVLEADPADTVPRASGHPGWIPIADDAGGNFLVVDLAPARHGRPGQVITAGVDWSTRPGYVAEPVTAVLAGRVRSSGDPTCGWKDAAVRSTSNRYGSCRTYRNFVCTTAG
ncbi:SMI1/KNR4 family protein [Plantactinospora sp. B5E13]|uniref:SMI1/KNR4 family protein n=1 Tax=Plantactinospora sp. B5E13 TaxID=3153758 RepID=UPI00325ED33D